MGALVGKPCAPVSEKCEQTLICWSWSRMKIFLFTFAIFLFFTGTSSDFAADLATFINETPAGYTVTQQIKGGNTCHCRVPASSSSSSSSAAPFTLTFGSSSGATTGAPDATAPPTTAAPTTAAPTTVAPPTTTVPTTTVPTTTVPTTTTFVTTGSAFGSTVG